MLISRQQLKVIKLINYVIKVCFNSIIFLDKGINFTSNNNAVTATPVSTINNNNNNNNNVNQAQVVPTGRSQITAKSEVSQATAISDRPKAKPKISRKHQQQQQQQAQSGATVSKT